MKNFKLLRVVVALIGGAGAFTCCDRASGEKRGRKGDKSNY
jgi:hypothetical protein